MKVMNENKFLIITLSLLILIIGGLIILMMQKDISQDKTITTFEECVAAGNPVMESLPRKCSNNGKTFVEEVKEIIYCTEEQKNAEACTTLYYPVCGYVQVECVTAPCDPVPQTFSNPCFACAEDRVLHYTEGRC